MTSCENDYNEKVWKFLNKYSKFNDVCLRVMGNTAQGLIPLPYLSV